MTAERTERTAHRGVYLRTSPAGARFVQARWSTPDGTGGRRQHQRTWPLPPKASKTRVADAVEEAARWRWRQLHGGAPPDAAAERLTVAELAERWHAGVASAGRARPATAGKYRRVLDRDVLPALGGRRLAALSALDVDAWLRARDARFARSTNALALAVLRMVVHQGVAWRLLSADPTLGARPGGRAPRRGKALSDGDARRLLALMDADPLRALWRLLLLLGLRVGEALALDWGAVDLERGTALIAATVTRDADLKVTVLAGTKTGRDRVVPLDPETVAALRELGRGLPAAPVFVGAHGRRLAAQVVAERRRTLMAAAGIEGRTTHDIRHSAATLLRVAGVNAETVAAILGHSPAVLMRVYSHPDEAAKRAAVEDLAKRLGGAG